jgi:hypothetical protein
MNKLLSSLVAATALLSATPSFAETWWSFKHPRRAEVNGRLENQDRRIDAGRRDGELTRGEAHQLHREDRTIRAEERAMAAQNGGHITKGEQRMLNRQENHVSRQIHREREEGR